MANANYKTGLKRYIKIALERQEVNQKFDNGELTTVEELDAVEKAARRFWVAVEGLWHLDINTIREAEIEAGIKEKNRAYC